MIKNFIKSITPLIDIVLIPFILLSAIFLKYYRIIGSYRLKYSTLILKKIGVFPIVDHYYEPLFNNLHLRKSLSSPRNLPGIHLQIDKQINLLNKLNYQNEFQEFLDSEKISKNVFKFFIENESFKSGDAEFLYNFIRHTKPKKIIEIGCGYSTLIISKALKFNKDKDDRSYEHICIEPFERPLLNEITDIKLIREKVENINLSIFKSLEKNDLLFIDSSHIIRPQGDVLFEFLEIIPSLSSGVNIQVHDIRTPLDYLENVIIEKVFFWNEQYILEAILSNNKSYEVVAALNYLKHNHYDQLKSVCQYLKKDREPGSFYFKKV